MRVAHSCSVCGKRIPICVRSDRRYCAVRCRVWASRHPGQKRPDYARGRVGLPPEPGRGRPKTFAAARAALEETRRYAAKLDAAARQQHSAEQKLLTELATLREGLAEVKRGLAAERDAARDDLAKLNERLGKVEEQKNRKTKESYKRLGRAERLQTRAERAERDAQRSRSDLGRAQADLAEARRTNARQNTEHAARLRELQEQIAELSRAHHDLTQQINTLKASAQELKDRAEQTEATLHQRDEELHRERQRSTEAKQARQDSESVVDLLQRRLEAEQKRRVAAEERIEQLLGTGTVGRPRQPDMQPSPVVPPGSPRLYQRHAAAAGYDYLQDPLFDLMRRDVLVADRYADWQTRHMGRIGARRRDPNQPLDDQAYAATLSARWRLVDHPHLRLGTPPQWRLLGFLLDERSERYLLMIMQERIDEMQSRLGDRR